MKISNPQSSPLRLLTILLLVDFKTISLCNFQDAIAAEQYIGEEIKVEDGDVEKALSEAEHVLEGEVRVGGQEHFYLETQACLVIPKGEQQEVEIVSSTQGTSNVQTFAALALGIPRNRIVSKVKRIGLSIFSVNLQNFSSLYARWWIWWERDSVLLLVSSSSCCCYEVCPIFISP